MKPMLRMIQGNHIWVCESWYEGRPMVAAGVTWQEAWELYERQQIALTIAQFNARYDPPSFLHKMVSYMSSTLRK